MRGYLFVFPSLFVSGCDGLPKGVEPGGEFELKKYLGTWYEIARLNQSFERGLDRVTAENSLLMTVV